MNHPAVARFLAFGVLLITGCTDDPAKSDGGAGDAAVSDAAVGDAGSDSPASDGGRASFACYLADQFVCEENPAPTADEEANLEVFCSSGSGTPSKPAACPTNGFLGKCTVATGKSVTVRRYYAGADAAYLQDYCVNTAGGAWSTTF